jgi:arsenate reductase-like glutaredoxin family protein
MRVQTILKQASAMATEHATEDQASDYSHQTKTTQQPFDLNITEDPPTPDQLKSILEYVGAQRAGTIIKGAKDEADAMRKLKENADNFQRPIVRHQQFLRIFGKLLVGFLTDVSCRLLIGIMEES